MRASSLGAIGRKATAGIARSQRCHRNPGRLCSGASARTTRSHARPLERTLPRGEHWRYEPKLDGFRGLLWHGDGATVQLLSRNVKDLSAWFPEVVQAGNALPSITL